MKNSISIDVPIKFNAFVNPIGTRAVLHITTFSECDKSAYPQHQTPQREIEWRVQFSDLFFVEKEDFAWYRKLSGRVIPVDYSLIVTVEFGDSQTRIYRSGLGCAMKVAYDEKVILFYSTLLDNKK